MTFIWNGLKHPFFFDKGEGLKTVMYLNVLKFYKNMNAAFIKVGLGFKSKIWLVFNAILKRFLGLSILHYQSILNIF